MMDVRKAFTRSAYRAERAAILAMLKDIRSGSYGAKTTRYLCNAIAVAVALRRAYWKRGNAPYRCV
jgi:hypothetical protein